MLDYPSASNAVAVGGCFSFGGGLLLLAAFLSPFWIQSYEATPNSFQNMGLWMYCFKDFRYPYNQFDKLFNGCQFVLSSEYDLIRGWVLPGWLMVVQTLITAALLTSYVGQITLASILIRYPLKFVLRNEWVLSSAVSVCNCIVGSRNGAILFTPQSNTIQDQNFVMNLKLAASYNRQLRPVARAASFRFIILCSENFGINALECALIFLEICRQHLCKMQ
ncbi:hypothetical protein QAD02_002214 [Eretmocerus hayati]|uniref:Uncharacterized protein n=1 Tax=Eretmocerus hayati TaxID=131215 RepID=A0ACC2NIG7_9HYME|nr:hypothetical protein QAD02_002214 [Eretmocerus hayati]